MTAFKELEPHSQAPATPSRGPELLAPAGNWECAQAAVENGADAIYFGLDRFKRKDAGRKLYRGRPAGADWRFSIVGESRAM